MADDQNDDLAAANVEGLAAHNDDSTVTYGDEFAAQLASLDGDVTVE